MSSADVLPIPNPTPLIRNNVMINRKTTLSILYTYEDPNMVVEYPETSIPGVGYLMRRNPSNWRNPLLDVVYSQGRPSGRSKKGEEETCNLLIDPTQVRESPDDDNPILCTKIHSSCQGAKVCPQVSLTEVTVPHLSASRALVRDRLQIDLETHMTTTSPNRLIFEKTAAFIAAVRSLGCGSPESSEVPNLPPSEQEQRAYLDAHQSQIQRGYEPSIPKCPGRISLEYNYRGKGIVVCEFYSPNNRFHLHRILDDSYDLDYIEAFFNEDDDELQRIEEAACLLGYGPLATCKNVTNVSSQRFHCRMKSSWVIGQFLIMFLAAFDHRDDLGRLIQLPMCTLPCNTKFTLYEPLEQFRHACPYVLLVSKGDHPHPIPLPTKTPPEIKDDLLEVLKSLDGDLADLTPRRFLRHPILQAYLRQKFPQLPNPTLSDLHSSLANREHLRVYIKTAKVDLFPRGTGWDGVVRLKEWQDANLPVEDHYIRCILNVPNFPTDEFDADPLSSGPESVKNLRLIVCMTPDGSRRLQRSQYLQSDIAFQRIEGYQEFEIAAMDSFANTSVIFLRIYLNRQTALAHKIVMDTVNDIVKIDTGSAIQWRHLHANSPNDTPNGMVLLWTADQHGGQAKGPPPVTVTATAVKSTAVLPVFKCLTGRDGRRDGRHGRENGNGSCPIDKPNKRCVLNFGNHLRNLPNITIERVPSRFLVPKKVAVPLDSGSVKLDESLHKRIADIVVLKGKKFPTGRARHPFDGCRRTVATVTGGGPKQLAQVLPGKLDLHQPDRLLSSLSPYEHLHRVFRVCDVHGKRNIRKCAVPEPVRKLMRSLICMRHPDWEGTIASICQLGGKAGEDWVQDKIRSKFAFEGWCWEKSHIPESVWRAGQSHSNLIESVHADVNREGVRCTLLGGLKKGQSFDTDKMRTLKTFEDYQIRPSYKSGHLSDNAMKSLKRKNTSTHRNLAKEDEKISAHNDKAQKSYEAWQKASKAQQISTGILRAVNPDIQRDLHHTRLQEFTKACQACERAEGKYQKDVEAGVALKDTGSGKIKLWAPL
ncbi:hypothetical protein K438DRAFT_1936105 [Mycena galopus ATCC 62051]|nr:hypothetical protein K438DRAFT_1936105 [Mycena galopus ATCC 62051]